MKTEVVKIVEKNEILSYAMRFFAKVGFLFCRQYTALYQLNTFKVAYFVYATINLISKSAV